LAFICALCLSARAFAQPTAAPGELLLRHEFWCEYEPHPASKEPHILTDKEVADRIRAEARWVFSGIIRGFDASYSPGDKARGVPEGFSLKPIAGMDWKAERLDIAEMRMEGSKLYAYVEYRPGQRAEGWYRSWRSADYPVSEGAGRASLIGGTGNRILAMQDAVRDALREYARTQVRNKPKQILAQVSLDSPPWLKVDAGQYVTRLRIHVKIKEIREWSAY
jgi:hypothetical protein